MACSHPRDSISTGTPTPSNDAATSFLTSRFRAVSNSASLIGTRPRPDATLDAGQFDLVVAAVHSLAGVDGGFVEVSDAYLERSRPDVVREYLAEIERLIAQWDRFDVLAHIDYAARAWPAGEGPYRTCDFEDDYRSALRSLAMSDRALEVDTRLPLDPLIVMWWRQEGGTALTFGSDVHDSHFIAQGLDVAAVMVSEHGFRPDGERSGFWTVG